MIVQRAVALVQVERVVCSKARRREIEVGVVVVVEVGDGHAGAERRDVRGDVLNFGVQGWGLVNEVDAADARDFTEANRGSGSRNAAAGGAGRQKKKGKKRHGKNGGEGKRTPS